MILLVNPRATRPDNRRFPLSLMAIGAALPETMSWEIVDGNLPGIDMPAEIGRLVDRQANTHDPVKAIALTVMPGPQLVSAVPLSKALKARLPSHSDHLGRKFRQPLSRTGAERFLCRLGGAGSGRA